MDLPPEEDAAELALGTVISLSKQFRVVQRLGEGGVGKVFKAFDPIMNRYVALKVMKVDVPEAVKRRFRLEARLCGGFSHPNLVRVLDAGTTKEHGLFWFAMEFLEGRDIGGALGGGRTVPLHVALEIFRQTLEALRYVHLRGIVHRDVKPANIFVTRDPLDPHLRVVKLLDFGVARDLAEPVHDDGGLVFGDPSYLAPEQAVLHGHIDERADLYALGMTFYESITGHHPFEDLFHEPPRELIRAHRERQPILPSAYLPPDQHELGVAVDELFLRACAKQPDDRFRNAREMQEALSQLQRFVG